MLFVQTRTRLKGVSLTSKTGLTRPDCSVCLDGDIPAAREDSLGPDQVSLTRQPVNQLAGIAIGCRSHA